MTIRQSKTEKAHHLMALALLLSVIEGLYAIWWTVQIPGDSDSTSFVGLSPARLGLVGVIGLGVVVAAVGSVGIIVSRRIEQFVVDKGSRTLVQKLATAGGFLLAGAALIPSGEWGRWWAAHERLLPLLVWGCLTLLQWSAANWLVQGGGSKLTAWIEQHVRRAGWVVWVIFGCLVGFSLISVVVYPNGAAEDSWYESGVPVLLWQVLAAALAGGLIGWIEKRASGRYKQRLDLILFVLVFLLVGSLWAAIPLKASFFGPGPFEPVGQFFPNSDAEKFDLQVQSALAGYGINSGQPLDRPFYPMFLGWLHLVIGQDFAAVVAGQAFLFALLPALVYLIGVQFGSRSFGGAAAAVTAMWGANLIMTHQALNTASPKQMLTEFPLGVILALIILLTGRWLHSGERKTPGLIVVIGGLISLAVYVRYSALPLLPIWVVAMLILKPIPMRRRVTQAGLLLVGFMLVTLPWHVRNLSAGSQALIPFSEKIFFVVNRRYSDPDRSALENITEWNQEPEQIWRTDQVNPPERERQPVGTDLSIPFGTWFPAHLVHNYLSPVMALPNSLALASMDTTIGMGGAVWDQFWDGRLTVSQSLVMVVQFFVLAAGFGTLYGRDRRYALLAGLVYLGVLTANAFGRTSGGRFIVPVSWMVLLPYMAGWWRLLGKWSFETKGRTNLAKPEGIGRSLVWGLAGAALIGFAPLIFEQSALLMVDPPDPIATFGDVSDRVQGLLDDETEAELTLFLDQWRARYTHGVGFYARQDWTEFSDPVPGLLGGDGKILAYQLVVLTGYGNQEIIFPYGGKIILTNQDEVLAIGCNLGGNRILARELIVWHDGAATWYQTGRMFTDCVGGE